eukprot:7517210-Lingulodinium_polyedra.AAC.1
MGGGPGCAPAEPKGLRRTGSARGPTVPGSPGAWSRGLPGPRAPPWPPASPNAARGVRDSDG